METVESYLALNLIPGLGPVRLARLIRAFGDPQGVLAATRPELESVKGLGPQKVTQILEWEKHADVAAELERVEKLGARIVTREDGEYPEALKHIYDAPILLYVLGKIEERDRHGLAMVGSRRYSEYGSETARRFSYHLAKAGMTIVSGLALGIDTESHKGALAAEGRTIAVVGSGLGRLYPPENKELAEKIAQNGAVISELPMHMRPDRTTFPMRNRIISGMSEGVLVVEAGLKSGAMITANQAAEQGRTTFAVPGRIDRPHSQGCHRLIQEGAKLVTEPGEILTELQDLFGGWARATTKGQPAPTMFGPSGSTTVVAPKKPLPPLSEDEEKIYRIISEHGGTQLDVIIETSGLSNAVISSLLLSLQMKQVVRQAPGNQFVLA